MNILVPYFIFVLSAFPGINYPDGSIRNDTYQTDVTIGAELLDLISIEGQIKTDMIQKQLTSYAPFQDEYYVRAFIEHRGFTLGIEHSCYHPVTSSDRGYQYQGGHNRIYFKFDSRGLTN